MFLFNGGSGFAAAATLTLNAPNSSTLTIVNPGAGHTASQTNLILSVTYPAATIGATTVKIGTVSTTAAATASVGVANCGAAPNAFFGPGAAATFVAANTQTGFTVSVVDVSDTAANLLFALGNGNTYGSNSAYSASIAISSAAVTAWSVQTADSASVPVISQLASGAACTSTTGYFLAYDGFSCQIGTLVPWLPPRPSRPCRRPPAPTPRTRTRRASAPARSTPPPRARPPPSPRAPRAPA